MVGIPPTEGPVDLCTWLEKYPPTSETPTRRYQRVKRLTDVTVVLLLAPLWLPLVAVIAAGIALSDPGAPVLFRQQRTGRDLHRFPMFKFRTMVPNAEELKAQLAHLNLRTWPDFKVIDDPRITRLGRVLRYTSLDALPQLFNVLRGDMSLVGPRPTSLSPEAYEPWQLARFAGPSGLTGLWQVEGRSHPSFVQRVRLDLAYLERACWRLDLEILLRTIPQLLLRKGV
jgi:lipopolysaccharide/colanic/teichoic acid biosynthesis glycosyltransferase